MKILCKLGFHKLSLSGYIRTWICNVWGQGWEYFKCDRCGKEIELPVEMGQSMLSYLTQKKLFDDILKGKFNKLSTY